MEKRLRPWVERANRRRSPLQPKLTVADAKRIASGLVGSAFARAQKKHDVQVFAVIAMSDPIHAPRHRCDVREKRTVCWDRNEGPDTPARNGGHRTRAIPLPADSV